MSTSPENTAQGSPFNDPASAEDLRKIWGWNAVVPETIHACVHQLIAEKMIHEAQAVCAWDGELTYGELDALSSTLADFLIGFGAGPEVIIPLCFEKSMWMPVAMMAVMKAGGASCALDVTQPEARLGTIMEQIKPTIILSSATSADLAHRMSDNAAVVTVDKASLDELSVVLPSPPHTPVEPTNSLYLVFTSGSTGTPKGVVITHGNFSSALIHQTAHLGFKRSSRVLDFASYAFDAAWYNTIHTLYAGGCLCIPSENSRRNDLAGSIRQLRPNFANLTPKLCEFLDAASLEILDTIELAGEAPDKVQVDRLRQTTTVRFAYGPAECSILSTVTDGAAPCSNIGHALGVRAWIVNSEDDSLLAPVGSIGELWIEGPLVGQGYLRDESRTAHAFVDNPPWLLKGGPGYPGRSGRVYRTGDLARYDSNDSSLIFAGRKDAQVKIRGQRVELGEVEHQILKNLPEALHAQVIADVIRPKESDRAILVAFLVTTNEVQAAIEPVQEALGQSLPTYMVPSFFIPVDEIPMTQTGKRDRRKLRELGATLTLGQLSDLTLARSQWRQPETAAEKQLQSLWASVLKVESKSVGADDNFLRIGGDSIGAMRLVVAAREKCLSLTVADIFKKPRLCDLARTISPISLHESVDVSVPPFSLLRGDMTTLREMASACCGVDVTQIEDIFPCTPLQEGLLALTAKKTDSHIVRVIRDIQATVDLDRFKASWEEVATISPILRTRLVDLGSRGLMQVIIDEAVGWTWATQLESYIEQDSQRSMGLGTPLARFGLVEERGSGKMSFVLTIHHSICDGWSVPLVIDMAKKIYQGESVPPSPPFQAFVRHIRDIDETQAKGIWRQQLQGVEAPAFPQLPTATYQPEADAEIRHKISGLRWPAGNSTPATLIKAAWSILASKYISSSEVLFGTTVSGRQTTVPGVERMTGPTIATVPVRVLLDRDESTEQLLQRIQEQAVETMAFEQMGLQWIRRISSDAERACQFQTLLIIQPPGRGLQQPSIIFKGAVDDVWDLGAFNPYALLLEFQLEDEGIQLRVSFDSTLVERGRMQRMVKQLESVLRQLCMPGKGVKSLSTLQTTSEQDLSDLWSWNATVPQAVNICVQDFVTATARKQPGALAVSAWDGELKYGELEGRSNRLAYALHKFGVAPGVIVPLCFEKSVWVPVAMLAVLKAGGTFTMLSPSLPSSRLASILDCTNPAVVVTSPQHRRLLANIPTICPLDISVEEREAAREPLSPRVNPSTPVAVQFTSGTTGKPKGILLDHRCVSTTAVCAGRQFSVGPRTRLFQFCSYMFDISIYDTFIAFMHGACLCIPSEYDRENNLGAALLDFEATWVFLSPSVARAIPTASAATLKTLVLGGEALTDTDVLKWADKVNTFNWYGPAECALSSQTPVTLSAWKTGSIGTNFSCNCWVVDTENSNSLVPIGVIGELVVQGPGLMKGYLSDPEKTTAAFVVDPPWLLRGAPGHPGRRGRLYRTGDLVCYNADGSLTYVGRKDSQVKIRGQRVELGDVEHHVLNNLNLPHASTAHVVAEVCTPHGTNSPTLVAFVKVDTDISDAHEHVQPIDQSYLVGLEQRLVKALPRHMIPAAYLAIKTIPITTNGKLDRKKLRAVASLLKPENLSTFNTSAHTKQKRQPETLVERQLQKLWGAILGTEAHIGVEDNFLQIGGDSIAAMRLVSAAREQGLSFTVSEVLRRPRLCDLAVVARPVRDAVQAVVAKFSLLDQNLSQGEFIREEIPHHLCASMTVSDCFPVTFWQATCIDLATRTPPRQWNHFVVSLPAHCTRAQAVKICECLWDDMDILKLVFIRRGGVYFQVLTRELRPTILHYSTTGSIENLTSRVCEDDLQYAGILGAPFTRFSVLSGPKGALRLVIRMSHAQYDSTTLLHMLRLIGSLLRDETMSQSASFPPFLQHAANNEYSCRAYWSTFLRSSKLSKLEPATVNNEMGRISTPVVVQKLVRIPHSSAGYTPATIFTSACAVFLGKATNCSDVTFGRLVSGRAMLPFHLRDTVGPCLNIIPVRVLLDVQRPMSNTLKSVFNQHIDSLQYDTIGFDGILNHCTDWSSDVKSFPCVTHYRDLGDAEEEVGGATLLLRPYEGKSMGTRLMDDDVLMISAKPTGNQLRLELATAGGLYTEDQLRKWTDCLATVIEAFRVKDSFLQEDMI
ncbi:hypothetical protein DL768_009343 [Monosporascus sp. mg162]|nr:hypothetical protein DL768_009343 [Monosporascus sp. mg162]